MSAIHISDQATVALVRQLAEHRGDSITETIKQAILVELEREGVSPPSRPNPRGQSRRALRADLEAAVRAVTLEYSRHMARRNGRHPGSRVYKMLARHGVFGTLELLLAKPTDGLRMCVEMGRIDLAFEKVALDPRFRSIISAELRAKASANLAAVGASS
jgi:hypothetical protein